MSMTRTLTSWPGGQHVVQAAEADVVGPAVTAHDPHRGVDQVVGQDHELAGRGIGVVRPARVRGARPTRSPLSRPSGVVGLVGRPSRPVGQTVADGRRASSRNQSPGRSRTLVQGQPHAQAELGVVLEQRVGPGRAPARPRWSSRGWSGGWHRRWRSIRWRSPPPCGHRTPGSGASGTGSHRTRRRHRRTRRAVRAAGSPLVVSGSASGGGASGSVRKNVAARAAGPRAPRSARPC